MAIRTVEDLTATPDLTRLPGDLTLGQTLASTDGPLEVAILYWLDGSHNVWFRRADQGLTKTLRFEATLQRAGTELRHDVTLAVGPGQGPMALVEIDATVEPAASGVPLSLPVRTAVVVRIQP